MPGLDESGDTKLDEDVTIVPPADTIIDEGDRLIIIGSKDRVAKFREK